MQGSFGVGIADMGVFKVMNLIVRHIIVDMMAHGGMMQIIFAEMEKPKTRKGHLKKSEKDITEC